MFFCTELNSFVILFQTFTFGSGIRAVLRY
jgi:hypothetical protein